MAKYETLQVDEEEQENDLCLIEGMKEVVEEVDEGELIVLRRALSGLKGYENEQRETIFHSRHTVKGKVCSLIISSGSCTNVSSLSMVEKHNLQGTTHPYPYNIQWLS